MRLSLDVVGTRVGKEQGDTGRGGEGEAGTHHQHFCGLDLPEPLTAGAGREEGEEIGHGYLEVDRGGDLAVGQIGHTSELHEGALLPGGEKDPEEKDT